MTGVPSLTVILPVYNGERYLRTSLDSVLAQSYRAFDLDIWDDGSKDGTPAVLDSYHDPRIRRFTNRPNKGLFPTLNVALREARGERLRLWAYDDIMKPHCLEREAEFWAAHPQIGMSYCQRDGIDADGKVFSSAPVDTTPEVVEPWLAAQISYYHGCMPGNISTVTVRKDVLLELGGFANYRQSADFDMWERVTRRYPMGFIRDSLMQMRAHPMQFSRWTGESLNFIREDRQVLSHLYERLPPQLQRTARNYHLRHRAIQYVHYMMRELMAGRFSAAGKLLAEVRQEGNLAWLLLCWLATANGRWFQPRPVYLEPSAH